MRVSVETFPSSSAALSRGQKSLLCLLPQRRRVGHQQHGHQVRVRALLAQAEEPGLEGAQHFKICLIKRQIALEVEQGFYIFLNRTILYPRKFERFCPGFLSKNLMKGYNP